MRRVSTFGMAMLVVAAYAATAYAAPAPLGPVVVASPDTRLVVSVAGTGQAGSATWRFRVDRLDGTLAAETHDRTLAELFFNLADGQLDGFCAFALLALLVWLGRRGLRRRQDAQILSAP